MSWDTAWGNSWGNSWGDAVLLVLAETAHAHAVEGDLLLVQAHLLVLEDALHGHLGEGSFGLTQANLLVLANSNHAHSVDLIDISNTYLLEINESLHSHSVDAIGYFTIPELRLVGALTDSSGAITINGLQCVVFSGTTIYTFNPVLQASSISVTSGQIGIQSSALKFENIGGDYLITFYNPGPPLRGGGPHPATVVNVNA